MSTYTTTLTRIYCCIAGRIWRILFLQRASFIFIDYSSEMICCSAITLVHLFNNNDDFVFCLFFFFHGFPDAFASTMQPWPKPWSVVTCWDTNVSYKEWWSNYLILAFSFIFFFFYGDLLFVCLQNRLIRSFHTLVPCDWEHVIAISFHNQISTTKSILFAMYTKREEPH